MIETSFKRCWDPMQVTLQLTSKIFDRPEVVCFSVTVRDRDFVPKVLALIAGPLTRESEKFGQTGCNLFRSGGFS